LLHVANWWERLIYRDRFPSELASSDTAGISSV
jgi:hypothetical protein